MRFWNPQMIIGEIHFISLVQSAVILRNKFVETSYSSPRPAAALYCCPSKTQTLCSALLTKVSVWGALATLFSDHSIKNGLNSGTTRINALF